MHLRARCSAPLFARACCNLPIVVLLAFLVAHRLTCARLPVAVQSGIVRRQQQLSPTQRIRVRNADTETSGAKAFGY
eukprot:1026245-Lingulodinium_polyedra.AAC.1